jgi:hypothetical protein
MKRTMLALATIVCVTAPDAYAQSSKAAWRFEEIVALPHGVADTDPGSPAPTGFDTGWVSILTTHIKTPNAKELAIGVSLQCGIVTDTTVRSKGGELDSAAAQGRIKVRVKITQPDGSVVYAEPDNGADLSGTLLTPGPGVTYCDRYQKLAAKFAGLNCTAANAVPGVQRVEVQARAQSAVQLGGTQVGAAGAEAFAGAGALSVETIRLVKDADGTIDLDDLR